MNTSEQLCRIHVKQIKAKLGILGVSTNVAVWRSKDSSPGVQIDLLISRKGGVINLCEIKYSKHPFEIKKSDAELLERKLFSRWKQGLNMPYTSR